MDEFKDYIWPVITLLAAGAGYFGKRFIESTNSAEKIDRTSKLLDIHGRLKQQGVTVDDLDDLEHSITQKRSRLRAIEDQIGKQNPDVHFSAVVIGDHDRSEAMTQAEMNSYAYEKFLRVERTLANLLKVIEADVSTKEYKIVKTSQTNWEKFRESQVTLAASPFEGGSMQPTVAASEMERLTVARIAELQDFWETHNL